MFLVLLDRTLYSWEDATAADQLILEQHQAMAMKPYIGKHLAENATCAKNYRDDRFPIFGKVALFYLSSLESTFIKIQQIQQPPLCR